MVSKNYGQSPVDLGKHYLCVRFNNQKVLRQVEFVILRTFQGQRSILKNIKNLQLKNIRNYWKGLILSDIWHTKKNSTQVIPKLFQCNCKLETIWSLANRYCINFSGSTRQLQFCEEYHRPKASNVRISYCDIRLYQYNNVFS